MDVDGPATFGKYSLEFVKGEGVAVQQKLDLAMLKLDLRPKHPQQTVIFSCDLV